MASHGADKCTGTFLSAPYVVGIAGIGRSVASRMSVGAVEPAMNTGFIVCGYSRPEMYGAANDAIASNGCTTPMFASCPAKHPALVYGGGPW